MKCSKSQFPHRKLELESWPPAAEMEGMPNLLTLPMGKQAPSSYLGICFVLPLGSLKLIVVLSLHGSHFSCLFIVNINEQVREEIIFKG